MNNLKYQLAPDIDLQPMESQLLVLDLLQNTYFTLNETARFFLESLIQGKRFEEIIEATLETFDIQDQAQLKIDFEALLAELIETGIIVRI